MNGTQKYHWIGSMIIFKPTFVWPKKSLIGIHPPPLRVETIMPTLPTPLTTPLSTHGATTKPIHYVIIVQLEVVNHDNPIHLHSSGHSSIIRHSTHLLSYQHSIYWQYCHHHTQHKSTWYTNYIW